MKVAHYLNQFFAGLGGEEAAGSPPMRIDGAVGPGRGLGSTWRSRSPAATTSSASTRTRRSPRCCAGSTTERPDVLVCGPSFGSGRYGYACGTLAREAARRGIPAVCGMDPESPGVAAAEGAAYVVPTSSNVAGMREALPRLAALARRLAAGEEIGPPEEEGYLPRGLRRNERAGATGAARAIELLLAKLAGETRTEVAAGFDHVPPPPPCATSPRAKLALVTEAGCVPQGNPDGLPTIRASAWLRYPLPADGGARRRGLRVRARRLRRHGRERRPEPPRARSTSCGRCSREGRIGSLHDAFYTTTGNGTPGRRLDEVRAGDRRRS